jgi:hypothetical protein
LQIVAVSVVRGGANLVLESPLAASKVRDGQPDVALALVRSVVHGGQQPLITWAIPGKGYEAIAGPIAFPSGDAFQQLPLAITHSRLAQHGQQPIVEPLQLRIGRFERASA